MLKKLPDDCSLEDVQYHLCVIEKIQRGIKSLRVMEGKLPPRALGLIMEWAFQHQKELLNNWESARKEKPLSKIKPLI